MNKLSRPIFLFEPHAGSMKRTLSTIEQLGFEAIACSTSEEATAALEDGSLEALLISYSPDGVELSQYIREFTSISAPLAAIISTNAVDAQQIVDEMGADGYVRRPFTSSALEVFLSMSRGIAEMRGRLGELQRSIVELEGKLQRAGLTSPRTGFHRFEAVKDLLVVEVRRAKRYGYPLAILMVGLDSIPAFHELNRPTLPREITGGLAVAIARSIRVIDLPIHYADDRIMVFLPHTDLAGAEEVGRRIKRRIKRITYRGEGITVQLTASVGVAGIAAGDSLTFSKLIRDATAALKAAQLKGGDKVMKRVSPAAPSIPEN